MDLGGQQTDTAFPSAPAAGQPQLPQGRPREPLLSPLGRLLLYIPACVATVVLTSIVFLVIVGVWAVVSGDAPLVEELLGEGQLLENEPGLLSTLAVLVLNPALILMTCLFIWLVDRRRVSDFGLPTNGLVRNGLLGAVVGVGFVAVSYVVFTALDWIRLTPTTISLAWWVLATLLVYPLIGFAEEFVYRGYLMQTIEEWRGRTVAIVITSVLFWMVHLGGGNMHEPLGIVAMLSAGVTFALCRYGTGSLWLPISFHATYDWALLSLFSDPQLGLPAFFEVEVTVPHWLVGPPGYVGVADLALELALLAGVYVFIYRPGAKRDPLGPAPPAAQVGAGVAQAPSQAGPYPETAGPEPTAPENPNPAKHP